MTMPPHIAHVTAPSAFGGLERVLSGLCPGLVQKDVRVTLIAVLDPDSAPPDFLRKVSEAGVDVVARHIPTRGYARERREVLDILRSRRVDLVHTHGYRSDVIAGTAARRAGFPVVSTLHGFTRQGWRGRLYEWIQLFALRRADALVAVSQVLALELEDRGIPRDRITVIQNGVVGTEDTLLSTPDARERLGLPADGAVVGWVGRFSVEKDPLLAVRSFADARVEGASMCMVGDGPLLESTRAEAERLGMIEHVAFTGAVAGAADLFRAFDALLLSSSTEGTPMAILEAAVAGIPVAATAVGGVPALMGEHCEGLAPAGDRAALALVVRRILTDDEHANALASDLRRRILGEGATDWVGQYEALYRRLLRDETRVAPS